MYLYTYVLVYYFLLFTNNVWVNKSNVFVCPTPSNCKEELCVLLLNRIQLHRTTCLIYNTCIVSKCAGIQNRCYVDTCPFISGALQLSTLGSQECFAHTGRQGQISIDSEWVALIQPLGDISLQLETQTEQVLVRGSVNVYPCGTSLTLYHYFVVFVFFLLEKTSTCYTDCLDLNK